MITLIIYMIRTKSRLCKNILYYFIILLKNDYKIVFPGFLIKNTLISLLFQHFSPFLFVPVLNFGITEKILDRN